MTMRQLALKIMSAYIRRKQQMMQKKLQKKAMISEYNCRMNRKTEHRQPQAKTQADSQRIKDNQQKSSS